MGVQVASAPAPQGLPAAVGGQQMLLQHMGGGALGAGGCANSVAPQLGQQLRMAPRVAPPTPLLWTLECIRSDSIDLNGLSQALARSMTVMFRKFRWRNEPRLQSFELSKGMLRSSQAMILGFEILAVSCCVSNS